MKLRIVHDVDVDLATLPFEDWPDVCKRVANSQPVWIKSKIEKLPKEQQHAMLAHFVTAALTPLTVHDL